MKRTRKALRASVALAALLACGAHAAERFGVASAQQPQPQEAPRRPQGPAAGPIIKLPRGEGQPAEQAQQPGEASKADAYTPKWEYCAITSVTRSRKAMGIGSSANMALAQVRYFPAGSESVEGPNEEDALANAFAKLGEDGWEFVAVRESLTLVEGNGHSTPVFYFKRPKRQE